MTQNDRYRYVYDGFGRLVALKDGPTGDPIATYGYNGLGFRIWEQPNGGDKRYFCYDELWRIVATFDNTNATPARRVIHHPAGLAGMGGSSYIDSVILEDANDSGDANLETRYYPLQNWRADVVCVGRLSGGGFELVEAIDYDTYGNAISRPLVSADYNLDGGVDGSDLSAYFADYELGEPSADANVDGGIDGSDLSTFFTAYEAGISGPSKGACAYSGCIAGYAGYVRDRFAPNGDLYHVRHRVYDTRMGTWTRRDPLGYVEGTNLYAYCSGNSIRRLDPLGTLSCTGCKVLVGVVTAAGCGAIGLLCGGATAASLGIAGAPCVAIVIAVCGMLGGAAGGTDYICTSLGYCGGGVVAPTPTQPAVTLDPTYPYEVPPATPNYPYTQWPNQCMTSTKNLSECYGCCVRHYNAALDTTDDNYISGLRTCYQAYHECIRNGGDFTKCATKFAACELGFTTIRRTRYQESANHYMMCNRNCQRKHWDTTAPVPAEPVSPPGCHPISLPITPADRGPRL